MRLVDCSEFLNKAQLPQESRRVKGLSECGKALWVRFQSYQAYLVSDKAVQLLLLSLPFESNFVSCKSTKKPNVKPTDKRVL